MKTDSIFYKLLQTFPSTFFELIGNTDPRTSTYGFGSQEVKQTSFTIDGIFLPPLRMRQAPIYFVEAQAYREEENFYYRFFGEIHLYLKDYKPDHDWKAVVIFTEKRFDPGIPRHDAEYEDNPRVQRIYLNKLPPEVGDRSIGLGLLQLIGTKRKQAPEKGRALIARAGQELTDGTTQRNFIELVQTVFIYKFPELNSLEVARMLGLGDLKQTRVYQEAQEEKQDELLKITVPVLLEKGMTVEEIAQLYKQPVEIIQRFASQN
ncbi:MAG: Rpn family recombination-promoting nuclease/putative transposase [Leptolyngbya sp. Prado105]|nr:Rpn family recombination-promoting nuclease/putative transposase [Leptolyngbya sp. Prado105]